MPGMLFLLALQVTQQPQGTMPASWMPVLSPAYVVAETASQPAPAVEKVIEDAVREVDWVPSIREIRTEGQGKSTPSTPPVLVPAKRASRA